MNDPSGDNASEVSGLESIAAVCAGGAPPLLCTHGDAVGVIYSTLTGRELERIDYCAWAVPRRTGIDFSYRRLYILVLELRGIRFLKKARYFESPVSIGGYLFPFTASLSIIGLPQHFFVAYWIIHRIASSCCSCVSLSEVRTL